MKTNDSLTNKNIIDIQNVQTGYKNKNASKVVSKDLNLKLYKGELVSLLGPNGCGKSTLMRSIAGLQPLLSGNIFINDTNIQEVSSKERAKYLSLVLTDRIVASNLTVFDIVSNGRYPYLNAFGTITAKDKEIIFDSLNLCSLNGWENRLYNDLSDGEKQKVLIARSLAQDTPLMLLDEPTAHLDLPNRVEIMRILQKLAHESNKAILISSHELDLSLQWSDSIWLMNTDGIIYSAIPEEIVLSGKLSDVFCNNHIVFDYESGQFKPLLNQQDFIQLEGFGTKKIWTKRALERIGYKIVETKENNITKINITHDKWIVSDSDYQYEFNSINETLKYLKSKK